MKSVVDKTRMKECRLCLKSKPLSEFSTNKGYKDGKDTRCKVCKAKLAKERYDMEKQANCTHRWLCGDEIIAKEMPGYFRDRLYTPVNIELQVCRDCGAEKRVQLWPHDQAIEDVVSAARPSVMQEQKETLMPASTNGHVSTVDLDDGPVEEEESFEVKYNDALAVIEHQKSQIDMFSFTLEMTLKDLANANRRARLAEIEMQMFKLEQERAQLLDQAA